MVNSKTGIKALCEKLLREQTRRNNRERRLPYARKLRILDQLNERAEKHNEAETGTTG